jgi:hypothetical protein
MVTNQPEFTWALAALEASWQSRWGEVSVSWATGDDGKQLTVIIPPGCRGRLEMAVGGEMQDLGSGRHTRTMVENGESQR